MELAGQHPGAAECHRAGRDPVGPEPRAPAAGRSADGSGVPCSSAKPAATFNQAEREAILRALRESGGVIGGPTGAAARLGLNRTTLHSKMQRLGIQRPSY